MRERLLTLAILSVALAHGADPEQLRQIYRSLDADVVSYWTDFTRQNPSEAWGWHYLGVAYAEAGAHAEAEDALLRAAELEPADAGHRLQLANFCVRSGRPREALEQFVEAEARETDPRRREAMRESRQDLQRILDDVDRSKSRQAWTGSALALLLAFSVAWFRRSIG